MGRGKQRLDQEVQDGEPTIPAVSEQHDFFFFIGIFTQLIWVSSLGRNATFKVMFGWLKLKEKRGKTFNCFPPVLSNLLLLRNISPHISKNNLQGFCLVVCLSWVGFCFNHLANTPLEQLFKLSSHICLHSLTSAL